MTQREFLKSREVFFCCFCMKCSLKINIQFNSDKESGGRNWMREEETGASVNMFTLYWKVSWYIILCYHISSIWNINSFVFFTFYPLVCWFNFSSDKNSCCPETFALELFLLGRAQRATSFHMFSLLSWTLPSSTSYQNIEKYVRCANRSAQAATCARSHSGEKLCENLCRWSSHGGH